MPFKTLVLGVDVNVESVELSDNDQIMAMCSRGDMRQPSNPGSAHADTAPEGCGLDQGISTLVAVMLTPAPATARQERGSPPLRHSPNRALASRDYFPRAPPRSVRRAGDHGPTMSKRARQRGNGTRPLTPRVSATGPPPADPERLLLDAIANGELDHSLHALADAANARLHLLHTVRSATALAQLTVGDEGPHRPHRQASLPPRR